MVFRLQNLETILPETGHTARATMALALPGYRLSHRLGSGGHGSVHLAFQLSLGRQVALKIVTDEDAGGPTGRARLEREGRTLAALDHPNVVRVYDYGSHEGISYLAMEYLEGPDLHGRLVELSQGRASAATVALAPAASSAETVTLLPERRSPAPAGRVAEARARRPSATPATNRLRREAPPAFRRPEHHRWVVGIAMQMSRALAALHGVGLVHRDIKPSNILFRRDGTAVLSDFGLALSAASTRITMTGEVMGTVPFMSPEQARDEPLSARSDIYSLGATLYECLSGVVPFDGLSAARVLQRLGRRPPLPLRKLNPSVPVPLARVIARAMSRDPKDRHASAAELLADLERVAQGGRIRLRITRSAIRRSVAGAVAVICLSAAMVALDPLSLRNETRLRRELRLAAEQGRALIEVDPSVHYLVRVVPSDADFGGDGPGPLAGFQAVPETLLLPQPASHVRVYFVPTDRSRWWKQDDPRAFVRLLRLEPVDEATLAPHVKLSPDTELPRTAASARCFPTPPTPPGQRGPWVDFAAQTYPLVEAPSDPPTTRQYDLRRAFAVAATECPHTALVEYARWWLGQADRRSVFAHPDEPPEVARWLDAEARTIHLRASHGEDAALVTFWLAVRVAGFLGGRLPRSTEWMLAAQDGKGHMWPGGRPAGQFGHGYFKESQDHLRPVDADLLLDMTERGVSGMAGNAREWLADGENFLGQQYKYAALSYSPELLAGNGGPGRPSGRHTDAPICINNTDVRPPDRLHGMRVFRDLLPRH